MASDMFVFDEAYYHHLTISPENTNTMNISSEISSNFFNDPLSLSDSSIDSLLQETIAPQISADEAQSLDQIAHTLFSNSPPSNQLETLSLSQQQQQTQLGNFSNGFSDNYSVSEIKTEEFQLGFESPSYNNSVFVNNSYGGGESVLAKFMQRSFSSNSFEGSKPGFLFQPRFDTLLEYQNFPAGSSPEIDAAGGQMRRVCSTGDLPGARINQAGQQRVCSSSPLGGIGEGSYMEEGNFKVGRYSAEERKERIDRYRAKRTQRNFNKTIKYACRKTLADNRPRIRGRFARNDDTGEIPKPTCFHRYEDDDDLWVDNLQEEEEERILGSRRGGGGFLSNFGGTHNFQYSGY